MLHIWMHRFTHTNESCCTYTHTQTHIHIHIHTHTHTHTRVRARARAHFQTQTQGTDIDTDTQHTDTGNRHRHRSQVTENLLSSTSVMIYIRIYIHMCSNTFVPQTHSDPRHVSIHTYHTHAHHKHTHTVIFDSQALALLEIGHNILDELREVVGNVPMRRPSHVVVIGVQRQTSATHTHTHTHTHDNVNTR